MADARPPGGKMKYIALARYGSMRTIGTFSTTIKNLRFGDKCILRSSRGTEWGEITSEPRRSDETASPVRPEGTILRRCAPKDFEHQNRLEEEEQPKELNFCAATIHERTLPMRLVSVEHLFGGEKIIFYFLADGRVDFRQLVKDLAAEYRTRIEMRQIGVRDEARLLAEYEHCGRELCCRTFMKDLQPVTMRMAKLQKTTLDPSKISGRCGRLMCCLRFEDETYAELKRALPKRGTRVRLEAGVGEVISSEILAQTITVELADHMRTTVELSEIQEILPRESPKAEDKKSETRAPEPGAAASESQKQEPRAKPPAEPQPEAAQPQQAGDAPHADSEKRQRRRRRPRRKSRGGAQRAPEQDARPARESAGQPRAESNRRDEPAKPKRNGRENGTQPQDTALPQPDGRDEQQNGSEPGPDATEPDLPTEEWWET
ncbi:MAG: regulatory iron-sulfur-containing complex subunit RicT [Planctomycetota bacterium]